MREHCRNCGRLLPIGQLRKVEGKYECLKDAPCKKAQEKLGLPQMNAGAVAVAEATLHHAAPLGLSPSRSPFSIRSS